MWWNFSWLPSLHKPILIMVFWAFNFTLSKILTRHCQCKLFGPIIWQCWICGTWFCPGVRVNNLLVSWQKCALMQSVPGWQGVGEDLSRCLRQLSPSKTWDFMPEQACNTTKLVHRLTEVPCLPERDLSVPCTVSTEPLFSSIGAEEGRPLHLRTPWLRQAHKPYLQ